MGISEWIAVVSVVVALMSLAHQQYLTRRQSIRKEQIRLHDGTQKILFEILHDPDLLQLLKGGSCDPEKARRFWQIWFNHLEIVFRQRGLFDGRHWEATLADIQEFLTMAGMIEHWAKHQHGYALDFRSFINENVQAIKEAEPQNSEAPPE